jgi:tungstate transport system ATP-binding protein
MRADASILPLSIENLGYSTGSARLLSGINLTVRPGQLVVILGPNGAGKSLLLRLCHGLIQPTEGRIGWATPEHPTSVQAMVFQNPVMLRRSVQANLEHSLALAGIPRGQRHRRVADTIERFGLKSLADRPARRLSGGEQQRTALARAWATRPQILFLDEPCAQLDPSATKVIEQSIQEINRDGVTVVMTTHDLGQARRLATDIAFLHNGLLVEAGPAATFFDYPETALARAFLASELLWQP